MKKRAARATARVVITVDEVDSLEDLAEAIAVVARGSAITDEATGEVFVTVERRRAGKVARALRALGHSARVESYDQEDLTDPDHVQVVDQSRLRLLHDSGQVLAELGELEASMLRTLHGCAGVFTGAKSLWIALNAQDPRSWAQRQGNVAHVYKALRKKLAGTRCPLIDRQGVYGLAARLAGDVGGVE